jgi:hypothetical protein
VKVLAFKGRDPRRWSSIYISFLPLYDKPIRTKLRSKHGFDRPCFGQIARGRKLKDGRDFVMVLKEGHYEGSS